MPLKLNVNGVFVVLEEPDGKIDMLLQRLGLLFVLFRFCAWMIGDLISAASLDLVSILGFNDGTARIIILEDLFDCKIHVIRFLVCDWELG